MRSILKDIHSLCRDFAGAVRITADARSCARLSADFCLSRMMRFTALRAADRERHIRLKGGAQLTYRLNRADIYTIHEVWIEEMYRLPFAVQPSLVVDLGANIGLTSLWLAKRYGCAQLVAVEPSPTNAALARKNLEANAVRATILQAAAGAEDGTAVFDIGPSPTNGRIVNERPASADITAPTQQRVSILSMASVLNGTGTDAPIDLIKIDIEGGEQSLLTGNTDWLRRVRVMIIEFHPALVEYEQLLTVLAGCNLERVSTLCTNSSGNTLEVFVRQAVPAHAQDTFHNSRMPEYLNT